MSNLIFGVSGVRGVVNSSFFPQDSLELGLSFGSFVRRYPSAGGIVVGRDTRRSGDLILNAFISGLLSTGNSVLNLGIVPTPTVLLNTHLLGKDGGAVITASHNPLEWNGVKFNDKSGIFLSENEVKALYKIYNNKEFRFALWEQVGIMEYDRDGVKRHIDRIFSLIDVEKIRERQFKVMFDGCHGALSTPAEKLLSLLGCSVKIIESNRNPEPVPSNLEEIQDACASGDFDIGFASDMDGDRIAVITEKGDIPGEEYTLALALSHISGKKKGKVVTNLSTSRMIDDIVGDYLVRTKVGEANVVKKMMEVGAVFGGEGNGGVIWPDMHPTRDGLSAISIILEYMADEREPISKLIKRLPSYFMVKEKIKIEGDIDIEGLVGLLPEGEIRREDGIRIDYEDAFIHIRKSNTEDVIRIICEAKRKEICKTLVEKTKSWLVG
ncbi:MAG: phosphoglucosamine mutase [candidate division WOR-3 bacterium]|nr:phosphoglucosamine mutase [candidate division WOR-3 bacterium]